jgi:hypothetical protein
MHYEGSRIPIREALKIAPAKPMIGVGSQPGKARTAPKKPNPNLGEVDGAFWQLAHVRAPIERINTFMKNLAVFATLPTSTRKTMLQSIPFFLTISLTALSFGFSPAAWAQTNTADGTNALGHNTTGTDDSAFGFNALGQNTTGSGNTATGWYALYFNTTGYNNTATGIAALEANGTGIGNTATGVGALANNGKGKTNTATGWNALYFNTGDDNTAIGAYALQDNSSGGSNIGIGVEAGFYLTTGSNNIEIGNQGVAADANTIRIGTEGTQTGAYIAGIFDTTVTGGCTVVVASTGQLGCVTSSARYKRDVRDMGDASDKLMKLRPVTFVYKADETGAQQYGLIAEEVERVYPELVIHDAAGKVATVSYHMLPAMLLNEVQKLARQLDQKDEQIATLRRQVAAMQTKNVEIEALAARLDVLERQARASEPDRLITASH